MRKRHIVLNWPALLLAAGFCLFAGYHAMALRHLARLQPAVIATVDLERVFNQLEERQVADRELQQAADELQARSNELGRKIDGLQEELELYPPESEKHRETLDKFSRASIDYAAYVEFARRKIESSKGLMLRRIYTNIQEAVREEAERNGYDIVFVNDPTRELSPGDESEINQQIASRRMLYNTPQIDITDDIVTRLNARHQAAAGE